MTGAGRAVAWVQGSWGGGLRWVGGLAALKGVHVPPMFGEKLAVRAGLRVHVATGQLPDVTAHCSSTRTHWGFFQGP